MAVPDLWWAGWLGGTVGVFLLLELWALRSKVIDKPPGTLTVTLRRWLGIDPHRWYGVLGIAVFAGGLVVLASHITIGVP